MVEIEFFEARDLPDAWFQCVYRILDSGHVYQIDKGSFQGQKRREFDFVVVQVRYPGTRPTHSGHSARVGDPRPDNHGVCGPVYAILDHRRAREGRDLYLRGEADQPENQ